MTFTLSAYRNSYDTKGVNVSLDTVVKWIRTGARGLDKKTQRCHVLLKNAPDGYKNYKENELPAVTFAGTFPRGKRKANFLAVHSSLVVLDVDDLSEPDIPLLLSELSQLKQVILAFVSPSGQGIKIVVSVSPVPKNDAEHKTAWHACVDFFQSLSDEYGFEIDPSGKDCSRLCYLAHDAQVITHDEVLPIGWDPSQVYLHTSELDDYEHSESDTSSLQAFLKSQDVKILGTRQRGGFFVECLNRAEHTGAKQGKTDSFIRLCENGLIYHCSHSHCADKKSGWFFEQRGIKKDPFRKTPKRYTVDADFQHQTSDIDTEREKNQNVLETWLQDTENLKGKHLIILGSAAGTGKTTVGITTPDFLLYLAKTTEEADQVFQTLSDAEDDVYRHRPRMFNRDHPDWNTLPLGLTEKDRPCISPELCNLYAERGHPTHEICNRCPLVAECKDDGYLSQAKLEKNARKVVYAWGEVVACDWIYRDRVKRICSKDDILILDEVNPAELTQHRDVTRDMLFDLTERFRDGHTLQEYEILKALLALISTAEDDKAFMDGLTAKIEAIDDIEAIDENFEKYPVGHVFSESPADKDYAFQVCLNYRGKEVTVPVVSHETAVDTPVFEVEADTQITADTWQLSFFPLSVLLKVGLVELSDPPRRFRRFLTEIKAFIEEHPDKETAPFTFDPKAQVFDFHLKPTLNHRRVIFNTASDPDNLISEAYRDANIQITRHTGETPAWKNPLVFQLSTGNYLPRHSLITTVEGELALKPRAQEMIDRFILPSIEGGLKTLIVAPKAFQEIKAVRSLQCKLINHHHAEGRNDFQDCDIAFIFHYEPNHHEIIEVSKRLYRNAEQHLDFIREKRTVTVGSVSFEKNIYTDERVQAVYNRECRQRLMQSAMRLRPNIHEGKIIVFLTAEPVNIPVPPIPFSLADGEGFDGDWQQLCENLQAGEKRSVKEITAQDGVSESTAYRQTAETRRQIKAERDVELLQRVLELKEQNIGERKIAKRLCTSYGKVRSLLKEVH